MNKESKKFLQGKRVVLPTLEAFVKARDHAENIYGFNHGLFDSRDDFREITFDAGLGYSPLRKGKDVDKSVTIITPETFFALPADEFKLVENPFEHTANLEKEIADLKEKLKEKEAGKKLEKMEFNPFEREFDEESKSFIANSAITTASKVLMTAAIMSGSYNYISGRVVYPNGENWMLKFYRENSGEPSDLKKEFPALHKLILFLHGCFAANMPLHTIPNEVKKQFTVGYTRHERRGITDPYDDIVYSFDMLKNGDMLEGAQLLFQLNYRVKEIVN